MVPAHSHGIPRAPCYSGYSLVTSVFVYWTFTFYGMLFLNISTNLCESIILSEPQMDYSFWFGLFLFRSPLLKESIFLSLPMGTKMFQFPTFPSHELLYSLMDNQALFPDWVSSFGYPRIYRLFAAPRGFSQLITSFFGSWCLGIHPMLFVA